MGEQVTVHVRDVVGSEGDLGKPIRVSVLLYFRRGGFEQNTLVRWTHKKTCDRAGELRAANREPEVAGVKPFGLCDVCDVNRHMIDAGNPGPWRWLLLL